MNREAEKKRESLGGAERPVSLSPLDIKEALSGLLRISDPDATKPKPKSKKAPPTPDKD